MDVELFFPLTERGPRASALIEQAKSVCRRCAVVHECLDAALALTDTDGIWGGLTHSERQRLHTRRLAHNRLGDGDVDHTEECGAGA
jgi:WhiB family redox-sensing transcriptional regulator